MVTVMAMVPSREWSTDPTGAFTAQLPINHTPTNHQRSHNTSHQRSQRSTAWHAERTATMDRDHLATVTQELNSATDGQPRYAVLLTQLDFTGQPRVWRYAPRVNVGLYVVSDLHRDRNR
jgi:hypothetical protein